MPHPKAFPGFLSRPLGRFLFTLFNFFASSRQWDLTVDPNGAVGGKMPSGALAIYLFHLIS